MVAMRDALDARITLEVALVRLTHPEADDDPAALLERIERLERRVQDLTHSAASPSPLPPPPPPPAAAPPPPPPPATAPPAGARPPADTESHVEESGPGGHDLRSQPALGAFEPSTAASSETPPSPPVPSPAPAPAPTGGDVRAPTRDEFVAAWGDHVLSQLRPRARAVFAVGRFVGTDGATAILALPNSSHVERASSQSEEVAEALGRYFGRRIDLRLVAESDVAARSASSALPASSASGSSASAGSRAGSGPARPAGNGQGASAGASPAAMDVGHEAAGSGPEGTDAESLRKAAAGHVSDDLGDEMLDPDDLDPHGENVGGDALSWAQDRLMEVFPGAEEV